MASITGKFGFMDSSPRNVDRSSFYAKLMPKAEKIGWMGVRRGASTPSETTAKPQAKTGESMWL
jgi:hypothetical protein